MNSGTMLLGFGVTIASAVDELVDHVMQPQRVGEWLEADEFVARRKLTQYSVSSLINSKIKYSL